MADVTSIASSFAHQVAAVHGVMDLGALDFLAWTREELSASEIDQMTIDGPIITGRNLGEDRSEIGWRLNGSLLSGDDSDPYRPASRAVDSVGDRPSACLTHGATQYLSAGFDSDITFDVAGIFGNFDRLTGLTAVRLRVAGNAAFTLDPQTIAEWTTPPFRGRLISNTLGLGLDAGVVAAARYTVQYVQVQIAYAGSGELPAISELFLGLRWTPPGHPLLPVALDAESSELAEFEPRSGNTRALHLVRQRGDVDMAWPLVTDAERLAARVWGVSAGAGARPCLVCARSGTEPERTRLVRMTDVFTSPWSGPLHQVINVIGSEQSPFLARDFLT